MNPRRWGRLLLVFALAIPAALEGQNRRTVLVDSARALVEDFNERQSIGLLQRALDPSLGTPDASWEAGVQLLAQVLLRNNQGDQATAWLRWALRLLPRMQVDSLTATPQLVAAIQAARTFVAANRTDSLARVRFEWVTTTTAGGFGDIRLESSAGPTVQVAVDGVGSLDPGRPFRLSPGSYRIAARAAGRPNLDFTTEVLPGVTTILAIALAPAADVIAVTTEREVLSRLARIGASRAGELACAAGFVAGNEGLLLSSYRAIRGASALTVQLATGQVAADSVRVAAYDVGADLAILSTGARRVDSLGLATSVTAGSPLWAAMYPDCTGPAGLTRVSVVSSTVDAISIAQNLGSGDRGGVVVNSSGAVAGLLSGPLSARRLGPAGALLATARRNLSSGAVLSADDVARRERHAFGSLALGTSPQGARARVSPLDPWQWPELTRIVALPFTFSGPMGRYAVEVLDGDRVTARQVVTLQAATTRAVTFGLVTAAPEQVVVGRGRRSMTLPIIGGVVVAGGLAALLMGGGGGGGGGGGETTGGITIRLP